jgi:CO dehydrogenase/acetyl-CoA synthase epsilon subunit
MQNSRARFRDVVLGRVLISGKTKFISRHFLTKKMPLQFERRDLANVVKSQIFKLVGKHNIVSVATQQDAKGMFTVKIGVKDESDVQQVLEVLRSSNIPGTFDADQTCIHVVGVIKA